MPRPRRPRHDPTAGGHPRWDHRHRDARPPPGSDPRAAPQERHEERPPSRHGGHRGGFDRPGQPQGEAARGGRAPAARSSWDPVADWYDGWMGPGGSQTHQQLAVPLALELLQLHAGERLLDIGCGQGVLADPVARLKVDYLGIDASPRLIERARHHHPRGRFLVADAQRLPPLGDEPPADAAIFLLCLQDMTDLAGAIASASARLRVGGRVVAVLTHPCFRIPRQSGWGVDPARKLRYRRVDRYLTPLDIPQLATPGMGNTPTVAHHRPLQHYAQAFAQAGLLIDRLEERPGLARPPHGREPDPPDIPLLLAIRAWKVAPGTIPVTRTAGPPAPPHRPPPHGGRGAPGPHR